MTDPLEPAQTVDGVSLGRGDTIMFCTRHKMPERMVAAYTESSTLPLLWECLYCDQVIRNPEHPSND